MARDLARLQALAREAQQDEKCPPYVKEGFSAIHRICEELARQVETAEHAANSAGNRLSRHGIR